MGPIGLILSTPLTLCLVVMGRHVKSLEFLDVLLGDVPRSRRWKICTSGSSLKTRTRPREGGNAAREPFAAKYYDE